MATDDDDVDRSSRLFTVRLWSERVGGGVERRGSVRAVDSGAFRNFREWPALTSFLAEQLDEHRPTHDIAPGSSGVRQQETPI
jgi:hypothetical protein